MIDSSKECGRAVLGFGTYRSKFDMAALALEGIRRGVRIIDSAPNYSGGLALSHIGEAVRRASEIGLLRDKEDLVITSKSGFVAHPSEHRYLMAQGVVPVAEWIHCHALHPSLIRYQLDQAIVALGRDSIDVLFLHNPEVQAGRLDRWSFGRKIVEAFEALESACDQGRIKAYGVATWSGFGDGSRAPLFTVRGLLEIANAVAGRRHRFQAIQLPISLVHCQSVADYIRNGQGPLFEAAEAGIRIFASSPLHGGELPRLIERDFVDFVAPGTTAAQACLLFCLSVPGVAAVLTAPSSTSQLSEAVAASEYTPLPPAAVSRILCAIMN